MTGQSEPRLLSFKASPELHRMLDLAAAAEDRNRSQMIRRAIMLYLEGGGYLQPGQPLDRGSRLIEENLERAEREIGERD